MRERFILLLFLVSLFSCKKGNDPGASNSLAKLITFNAGSTSTTTATCSGTISSQGGSPVTARGVCWSTGHNPDVSGNHTTNGSGIGTFTSSITGLTPGTLYYVRAYATNSTGVAYGNESSLATPGFTVYVAGVDGPARVWTNNLPTTPSGGTVARSVIVSGNDIYAAGSSGSYAAYWKNGVKTDLAFNAEAWAIVVSGTDVYVAGHEKNAAGYFVAKVWKNGVATILSDGSRNAYARALFVSGSNVYVGGVEYSGTGQAKLWTNGSLTNLTNGMRNADVRSVFVSGSDIYVAGSEENIAGTFTIAKYWKNGVPVDLTDGTSNCIASSIIVSGTDVYIAGAQIPVRAKFWKNGVLTNLTGVITNSSANSVFLWGNDVYIAGSSGNIATVWLNGTPTSLSDGSHTAIGFSVFVAL